MTRSALRNRAISAGRAWIWCGSWRAVVALNTLTSLPPSSVASAAHSGSQANTLSAAWAAPIDDRRNAAARAERRNMVGLLESVGAMRAQADGVLQNELVVGRRLPLVAIVLQAEAAELTGAVI